MNLKIKRKNRSRKKCKTIKRLKLQREIFRKTSFICNAKKAENIIEIKTKNRYINKTDCLGALKKIKFLMLKGSLFFE